MRAASTGVTISVQGRGPPWIVVDHEPASAIVARWPGRLWRARIVEAATDRDQRASGGPPVASARYTRCISILIEGEEQIATLFGPHGSGVVHVLEKASQLSRALAEALAANRHAGAAQTQDRVWRNWLRQKNLPDNVYEQLDGTLAIGVAGSPINQGLSVLHGIVFRRAQSVDADAATDFDAENIRLIHPWDGAGRVFGDAALALGAPDLMDSEERAVLLHGWSKVFGAA